MNRKEKVLIVDDEKIVRIQLGRILAKEGLDVTAANSGEEALQLMEREEYDIVLSDMAMGDMDGLELLKSVKRSYPSTIFLIITGHGTLASAIESMRLGAFDYLLKPCENDELKMRVQRGLEQRRLQRKVADQNRRLEQMAITDGLTGLYTRSYFMNNLDREFKHFYRYKSPLSFMMIDIDHFKQINDRFGHQVGYKVLHKISRSFSKIIRETDIIGRYGGEEFGIILPTTDIQGARITATRIRTTIEQDDSLCKPPGKLPQQITVSIGLAACPYHKLKNASDLIRAADTALYEAKRAGRNRVVVFGVAGDASLTY